MKNSKIRKKLYENTEKLKRALESSILGPQNVGSGGPGPTPGFATVVISHFEEYIICDIRHEQVKKK